MEKITFPVHINVFIGGFYNPNKRRGKAKEGTEKIEI